MADENIDLMLSIANHLDQLGRGKIKPVCKTSGACNEAATAVYRYYMEKPLYHSGVYLEVQKMIYDLISIWPKRSGHPRHPVQHPTEDAREAYERRHNLEIDNATLWGDDEYGDNRRELCIFLAEMIRKRYDAVQLTFVETGELNEDNQ